MWRWEALEGSPLWFPGTTDPLRILGEEDYWVGKLFRPQKAWLRSGPAPETLLDRFTAWTIPK